VPAAVGQGTGSPRANATRYTRIVPATTFPPAFADGVRLFNAGEFFAAHEAFEELLDAVEEDGRWDLLVALVQVAVGYHKLSAGHPGGRRMLGLGLDKLQAFPAHAWGVRVDALRARVGADVATLDGEGSLGARLAETPPAIELA
jgi:predicted metal-dependent hydrolase